MSNASQAYLKSLAASGTANVDIPLSGGEELAVIQVSAAYAAVSATASGVSALVQVTTNNSLYTASNAVSLVTAAPAAGNFATQILTVPLGNNPACVDAPRQFKSLRVVLTNGDGTNAAATSVVADLKQYPR